MRHGVNHRPDYGRPMGRVTLLWEYRVVVAAAHPGPPRPLLSGSRVTLCLDFGLRVFFCRFCVMSQRANMFPRNIPQVLLCMPPRLSSEQAATNYKHNRLSDSIAITQCLYNRLRCHQVHHNQLYLTRRMSVPAFTMSIFRCLPSPRLKGTANLPKPQTVCPPMSTSPEQWNVTTGRPSPPSVFRLGHTQVGDRVHMCRHWVR